MRSVFHIGKMDCPTEEGIIRNRLKGMEGVEQLDFDLMSRKLTVIHGHSDESAILRALESVGMDPRLVSENEPESAGHEPAVPVLDRWLMGASGVLAVAAEVIAWTTGTERSWPVIALALGSIALGGRETIRKGIVSLRTLTLNINFLMTIAIIGAAFIGQWPEAAMVTFLFGVAEMVEAFSLDRARHAIRALMEMSPEHALALVGNEWVEIEASRVAVGQLVRVRPGERIALDGLVKEGSSSVNQAPITGESIPVAKSAGDQVFAGTINEKGSFDFEVTANTGQTTLARIIRATSFPVTRSP